MLNNQRTGTLLNGSQQELGLENSGPGPVHLALWFLRRHYLLIIVTTALSLAASVIFLKVAPPTYTAQAKVLLGSSKAPVVQPQTMLDDTPVDLESQIEILKSKAIATSVINQLNLANDPDFNGKGDRLHAAAKAIREMLGIAPQDRKIDPVDQMVDEFQSRLSASRIGMSNVIEVSFNSSNPERAAAIANATAKAYFDDQLKAKTDEHRTATAWLHDRLQELGNDALNAERAVNELKTKSNIVSADGKFIDEQQVTELNSRLVVARTRTAEAMARLIRFESLLASNNVDSLSVNNPGTLDAISTGTVEFSPLSISDLANSQTINSLRRQYVELASREYEYSAKYGNEHLAVVNLRATMRSIRHAMLDELHRLAEISKGDFEVAKRQQQEVEKQLTLAISQSRNSSSAELSIRELETSAKGYRALYESFLQRYMGSVQQGSFPITEARVISPATPPQKKSKPKTTLLLALGMFGGIALGAALGFARELKDRGFRTTAQIEGRLRVPCLSVVPLLRHGEVKKVTQKSAASAGQADKGSGKRTLARRSGTSWLATAMPTSRFAESIRSIRLAIDLDPTRTPSKVIGLTSTLPDEGKSTIAASLAQLLANSGRRVIVVDCDLRNPSLSATLAPDARAGIPDIVSGARSLEDTVWTDAETSLDFLPGKGARISDTSDILCKEQTKKLFGQLRATYDYVIVDLPPLAPVVDARAISALLDSFILVVEWGRTTTDVVEHALNTAPNVYDALLGVVLNKTDMKAMKRYADHYGDYFNDDHYIRYGQLTAE